MINYDRLGYEIKRDLTNFLCDRDKFHYELCNNCV